MVKHLSKAQGSGIGILSIEGNPQLIKIVQFNSWRVISLQRPSPIIIYK
jgi:hypothetical protein